MSPVFILEMLAVGAGVGVLSAALGIGGGVLMVPAFVYFVDGMDMNTAKGSSLLAIVFVAAWNAWRMNRGPMRSPWSVILAIAGGAVVGGYLGGWFTSLLSDRAVSWIFIALLLAAGFRTFFLDTRSVRDDEVRERQPLAAAIGLVSGTIAGGTGTGGGAILVPLALWAGIVSNRRVVALSNSVMFATACAGVLAHLAAEKTTELAYTYGLVNVALPPFVILGAVLAAPLGRALNARLSLPRRRLVMGLLLLFIAARLAVRALV